MNRRMSDTRLDYNEEVGVYAYDRTIVAHPYVQQMHGAIIAQLLKALGHSPAGKKVLDIGAGTGEATRVLLGIEGLVVHANDISPESRRWFSEHPELRHIPFHQVDFIAENMPERYDAITAVGIYHHLPKAVRPAFLRKMCDHAAVLILADEALLDYKDSARRWAHCQSWYGHVIGEARRRQVDELADLESSFLEHERQESADDGMDYKEDIAALYADAKEADVRVEHIQRLGDWEKNKGGIYVATVRKNP